MPLIGKRKTLDDCLSSDDDAYDTDSSESWQERVDKLEQEITRLKARLAQARDPSNSSHRSVWYAWLTVEPHVDFHVCVGAFSVRTAGIRR